MSWKGSPGTFESSFSSVSMRAMSNKKEVTGASSDGARKKFSLGNLSARNAHEKRLTHPCANTSAMPCTRVPVKRALWDTRYDASKTLHRDFRHNPLASIYHADARSCRVWRARFKIDRNRRAIHAISLSLSAPR